MEGWKDERSAAHFRVFATCRPMTLLGIAGFGSEKRFDSTLWDDFRQNLISHNLVECQWCIQFVTRRKYRNSEKTRSGGGIVAKGGLGGWSSSVV